MNYIVFCWASGCESRCAGLSHWLWIIVNLAEPVVVNHCELSWASCCETLWVLLIQWIWIMVCYSLQIGVNHGEYAEPEVDSHSVSYWASVVNHCELCWDSGSESWCAMISKYVGIVVCYSEPMVVNHYMLCWTCGCVSYCGMLSQWVWIMLSKWL